MSNRFEVKFDNHGSNAASIEVVENEKDDLIVDLWVNIDGVDRKILTTWRDQWGVFIEVGGVSIAQEDGTRSFLDALSQAIQYLRTQCEFKTTAGEINV